MTNRQCSKKSIRWQNDRALQKECAKWQHPTRRQVMHHRQRTHANQNRLSSALPVPLAFMPRHAPGKRKSPASLDPAAHKQLRQLGLDRDMTTEALLIEAINDLFKKYAKRPIAYTKRQYGNTICRIAGNGVGIARLRCLVKRGIQCNYQIIICWRCHYA